MTEEQRLTLEERVAKASVLGEALPYMRKFAGATVVIKYGGHAMGDNELGASFARDVVLMKQVGINPIIVHGGGPQIGRMLDKLKIQSEFIDGLRVTDAATVDVVEMVLAGSINKAVVTAINQAGGRAVGISGKDARLVQARKLERKRRDPDSQVETALDLGFVGEPVHIDTTVLDTLAASKLIPVVAPIGVGADGETFNINADTTAGAIAAAVRAQRFLLLTDVMGVLDGNKSLIEQMTRAEAQRLIEDGTISGGMIPKVQTCLDAVDGGVEASVIMDGRVEHALLLEIFTAHGVGTMISRR